MVSKPTSNYPAVSIHNGEVLVKQQTEGEVISTSRLVQQSERSRKKLSLSFHNQDHVFNTDDDLMTNEKVQHSVGQRGGTQNSPVDHSKKHLRVGLNQVGECRYQLHVTENGFSLSNQKVPPFHWSFCMNFQMCRLFWPMIAATPFFSSLPKGFA